jgi:hypothetical protein
MLIITLLSKKSTILKNPLKKFAKYFGIERYLNTYGTILKEIVS